jgi:cell division protein FtsI/penicillin-binding protein 2
MKAFNALIGWFVRGWARHSRLSMSTTRVLALALAAVGLYGAFRIAEIYAGSLLSNRQWVETVNVQTASELTGQVFQRLSRSGLITLVRDNDLLRIFPASCENLIAPAFRDPEVPTVGEDKRSDLRMLCESAQGEEIRNEIDVWNNSFRLIAVRDDRSEGSADTASDKASQSPKRVRAKVSRKIDRCYGGEPPTAPYIEQGCKPNHWTAGVVVGDGVGPAQTVTNGAPPPGEYALIPGERAGIYSDLTAHGGGLGAGDWLLVRPSTAYGTSTSDTYRLSSHMRVGPSPIIIDLVGTPTALTIDGKSTSFTNWRDVIRGTLGSARFSAELICDERDSADTGNCTHAPRRPLSHFYAVALTAGTAHDVDVSIDIQPVDNLPRSFLRKEKLIDAGMDLTEPKVTIARTAHLRAQCTMSKDIPLGRGCALTWITPTGADAAGDKKYHIVAGDGVTQLVDEKTGVISREARRLDLDPIVGLGPADSDSLTAALAAAPRTQEKTIKLAIDQRMQALAFKELIASSFVGKCPSRIAHWQEGDAADCSRNGSRAAIVLVDAEQDPGAILAMASWPPVSRVLNVWDLLALAQGYESQSPLAGAAWRAADAHDQPGSTFKAVTSLMAIEHALREGDQRLGELLLGEPKIAVATTMLRLGKERSGPDDERCVLDERASPDVLNVLPVKEPDGAIIKCLHNAETTGEGSLRDNSFLSPQATQCVKQSAQQVGICEAIISSSNLFFGGLAQLIDRPKLDAAGRGEPAPLEMVTEAKRLFPANDPDTEFDILHGILRPRRTKIAFLRAARLMADPLTIDAGLPNQDATDRRLRVAMAGFGQSVTATTLAMASIYASIGGSMAATPTGIIRPHLLPRDSDEYKDARAFKDPEEGRPLLLSGTAEAQRRFLDQLKQGFAGVVPHGTGRGIELPKLVKDQRLFLKTGTATINETAVPRTYSSWVAGWVEAKPGSGITSRIAFACWVSKSPKFGEPTCGPIIQHILDSLDRAPAK